MASIIKDSITKGVTYGINYQGLNHKGSHIWYQLSMTRSIGVNHEICYQDSIKRSQRWNLLLRLNQKESKLESAIKTQSKSQTWNQSQRFNHRIKINEVKMFYTLSRIIGTE